MTTIPTFSEVLIDGDIVAYRCAASAENDFKNVAWWRVDDVMDNILGTLKASHFQVYISGEDNYRKVLSEDYKANRKDTVRPKYLELCREHLVTKWGARMAHLREADDELGIAQTEDTCIASIDKDLLMIAGHHFNFVKNILQYVSPIDGIRHFWKQMLIGDTSDNIFGIRGIGKVKAARLIDPLDDSMSMGKLVHDMYKDDERFLTNANLLWIKRYEDKLWPHDHEELLKELNLLDRAMEMIAGLRHFQPWEDEESSESESTSPSLSPLSQQPSETE